MEDDPEFGGLSLKWKMAITDPAIGLHMLNDVVEGKVENGVGEVYATQWLPWADPAAGR